MRVLRYFICSMCVFFIFNFNSFSQNRKEIIKSLSLKDKIWVMKNYSSIKKAYKISLDVLKTMDSLNRENFLGGNTEGGKFDAFRHIYWTYSLTREIGDEKTRRVGEIYENYNRYIFNNIAYSGYDSVSMTMDLFNNDIGIELGKNKITDSLIFNEITNIIFSGKAKIVKKNTLEQSLDENDNVIPEEEWKKKWINNRKLVNSNYKPKQ